MALSRRSLYPLALSLGFLLGFAGPERAAAKGPGKTPAKAPASSENAAIDAVIDSRQSDIRDCALQHGISQGATKVELNAKLLINNGGQVLGCQVTAKVDGGDAKGLETCVQKVLRATRFGKSSNTLRNLLRHWKFATQ